MSASVSLGAFGQPEPRYVPKAEITLGDQIELARLVDIAAQRLKVNIEYDAALLKGTVTLRLGAGVTDDELWDLTNRLLAARGFTTVRPPGREGVLSVVKLEAAAGLSKLTGFAPPPPPDVVPPTAPPAAANAGPDAGFGSVVYRLKHRTAKDLTDAVKQVVSKPGGNVGTLGDSLLLITDLTPRIEQTLAFLETIDVPGETVEVLEVPAAYLSGTQLATLAAQVVAKRDLVSGQKLVGEILPGADGKSVLVIAPKSVQGAWLSMLSTLDKREPLVTQTYAPRYFELKEVQRLVEETARAGAGSSGTGSGGGGSGGDDRLRVVADDLTGTLIITATATQHEQIAALIDRLNSVPAEGRRPIRYFTVRNRGVNEVLGVLQSLVSTGELAGLSGDSATPDAGGGRGSTPGASSSPSTAPPANAPLAGTPARSSGLAPEGNPSRAGAAATTARNQDSQGAPPPGPPPAPPLVRRPGTGNQGPDVVLTADEGTGTIIALGDPRVLTQIEQLIKQLDVRQPQVMVQALVVSLNDSESRDLGIELEGQLNLSGDSLLRLSSLFGLSSGGTQVGQRSAAGAGGTGLLLSPGEFAVVIRALETINKGRSVSMPQVLVNNSQQATFNSTIEQPFASILSSTDTQARTSFGGSSSAGTVVTAKPQIGQGDHLILDYTVELSAFVGQAASENLPPPKQTNNVASSVTLPDGYTVAVGGLELTTDGSNEQRVPLLSSIPILGEVFKNRSRSSSRSRFFVFLRAEVMRHERFEDLKYVSELNAGAAHVNDGWPELAPRVIR